MFFTSPPSANIFFLRVFVCTPSASVLFIFNTFYDYTELPEEVTKSHRDSDNNNCDELGVMVRFKALITESP
jgi:hypothetical protein